MLSGRDVIAQAATGSGKTAAFVLPILQLLKHNTLGVKGNHIRALILAPTRELARQLSDQCIQFANRQQQPLRVRLAHGGVSINPQMLSLRAGADILVATPGRLLELHASGALKLAQVKYLVLDEADRLLNLGFTDELTAVLRLLPKDRQTSLFSATFDADIAQLAEAWLKAPQHLKVDTASSIPKIEQRVYEVNREQKSALLTHLLKSLSLPSVLVFVNAKLSCDRLAQKLIKAGIDCIVFHGDKSQGKRHQALDDFMAGKIPVLIATDIAARGLDIQHLPAVINFELPRSPADYVHRIGRTGRAGEAGLAISLICHEEYHHFGVIAKKNKLEVERLQLKGFTPKTLEQYQQQALQALPTPKSRKPKKRHNNSKVSPRS
ncbi:DEAD/DEAH box helicase [Shewanella sp. NIFS-20-20]|nr:DEAD/DEAH box helicase [Shewanella sp. NIFS-20-20]